MKKGRSIIWGLVLVAVGVLLGLNAVGLFDFDILFDGWWTLFIIIPSLIGLFSEDGKSVSAIFLVIGILLLLACQNIIDYKLVSKLIFPIIIVIIGLSLLFKNLFNSKVNKAIEKIKSNSEVREEYTTLFSGEKIRLDGEKFKGTTLNAIFGGIELDLRDSIIKEDVVINANAIFGGIDIFLPENVKVEVKPTSIFGGTDNKYKSTNGKVTVYIDSTCVFGGLDIK